MKKVRRRAGRLAVPLVIASLTMLPGVGAASGPWRWVDPPYMGDPDTPGSGLRGRVWPDRWQVVLVQPQFGRLIVIKTPARAPRAVGNLKWSERPSNPR